MNKTVWEAECATCHSRFKIAEGPIRPVEYILEFHEMPGMTNIPCPNVGQLAWKIEKEEE